MRMHDAQVDSDEALVERLLRDQFPEWAHLPIRRDSQARSSVKFTLSIQILSSTACAP